MCRFKAVAGQGKRRVRKFQYIICVGSSSCLWGECLPLKVFQYIICVGSRFDLIQYLQHLYCFNTSYVSVQGFSLNISLVSLWCFNTSYVSVQGRLRSKKTKTKGKFQYIICVGSSFVSPKVAGKIVEFQYIICVGSSITLGDPDAGKTCFNTSYVSVQVDVGVNYPDAMFRFNTSYVSVQERFFQA